MYGVSFFRIHLVLFALLGAVTLGARGADAPATKPALTPEQSQKIAAAKTAALKDAGVKEATDKAAAARKAYQTARDSGLADESRAARLAYADANKELEKLTRAAMIAADPSIEPLLDPLPKESTSTTRPVAPSRPAQTPDQQRIDAAKAAVLRDPAMKPVRDRFNEARKAYQADRAKFPNERNKDVAVAFREATKEYDAAVRKAMIEKDPTIAALLDRKMNEGEGVADSDVPKNPAVAPIQDVPGLPRVLLIGDSVSIGYTLQVRELLKGKANVHRIPINGGATEVGLEKMKEWLGDAKWDVIHFNFGLHDAKHMSTTECRSSREQYAENLRKLIAQMKPTGAKLIFGTTTPVPMDGKLSPTRVFDSIPERNAVAVKVMQENDVAIDDLYSVILPVRDQVGRPNDVHFGPAGYDLLAKAVAASIEAQLPPKAQK
ncbi:MAG TPA: GDSL-type esterase/lipase family protein [Tepidisphaeraceae bacterium]|jgi:acyl-CoA thioesterase-1|nr:GDSL-type esterase/lipase family protein [Tepidisphaeraceae bacterium]